MPTQGVNNGGPDSAPQSVPSAIELRGISKAFGPVQANKNINLVVPKGTIHGIIGENGAGKSTLMRTIATLQDADSGSISLDGLDVLKDKTEARRRLGYLPEEFGVYPKVSAEAMLDHFAVLKGVTARKERKDLVQALLQQVNLWNVRKRKLGTFSGGMRQRFGIAQALIGQPSLIIVDEPTAGLDPEERNRFLNLLAEIGENVAVILSTHIVEDVTDLCPTMAIMNKGQVLLTGKPNEAISALNNQVWRKQVSKATLPDYESRHTVLSTRLVAGNPVIHVFSSDLPEEGFVQVDPDLEDVYFQRLRLQARTSVQAHA